MEIMNHWNGEKGMLQNCQYFYTWHACIDIIASSSQSKELFRKAGHVNTLDFAQLKPEKVDMIGFL